jgi:hypothetical protein
MILRPHVSPCSSHSLIGHVDNGCFLHWLEIALHVGLRERLINQSLSPRNPALPRDWAEHFLPLYLLMGVTRHQLGSREATHRQRGPVGPPGGDEGCQGMIEWLVVCVGTLIQWYRCWQPFIRLRDAYEKCIRAGRKEPLVSAIWMSFRWRFMYPMMALRILLLILNLLKPFLLKCLLDSLATGEGGIWSNKYLLATLMSIVAFLTAGLQHWYYWEGEEGLGLHTRQTPHAICRPTARKVAR